MQPYLITTRGARILLRNESFTLDELQDLVDGWVDIIQVDGGVIVFDADGKEKDKYMNFRATEMVRKFKASINEPWDDFIAGTAVFCPDLSLLQ